MRKFDSVERFRATIRNSKKANGNNALRYARRSEPSLSICVFRDQDMVVAAEHRPNDTSKSEISPINLEQCPVAAIPEQPGAIQSLSLTAAVWVDLKS